jgi:hypothetical protein
MTSVRGWFLDVVDDHDVDSRLASVHLEAQLVLHRCFDDGHRIGASGAHVVGVGQVRREVEGKVVFAGEAGLVDDGHVQRLGEEVGELLDGHGTDDGAIGGVLAEGRGARVGRARISRDS